MLYKYLNSSVLNVDINITKLDTIIDTVKRNINVVIVFPFINRFAPYVKISPTTPITKYFAYILKNSITFLENPYLNNILASIQTQTNNIEIIVPNIIPIIPNFKVSITDTIKFTIASITGFN